MGSQKVEIWEVYILISYPHQSSVLKLQAALVYESYNSDDY